MGICKSVAHQLISDDVENQGGSLKIQCQGDIRMGNTFRIQDNGDLPVSKDLLKFLQQELNFVTNKEIKFI